MLIARAIYFGDKYGPWNASKMTRSESLMQNHFHKRLQAWRARLSFEINECILLLSSSFFRFNFIETKQELNTHRHHEGEIILFSLISAFMIVTYFLLFIYNTIFISCKTCIKYLYHYLILIWIFNANLLITHDNIYVSWFTIFSKMRFSLMIIKLRN
jgi:hypothetical protein